MRYTYLLVDIFSMLVPFIFSFHPKIRFYQSFKSYWPANLIAAFIFIIWDAIFTSSGVWGFSEKYTMGWRIFGLPLEEILFFICIPYACVFTYHCLNLFFKIQWKKSSIHLFAGLLSLSLISMGLFAFQESRAYTYVTFISTGIFILLLQFVFKVKWLDKIFSIYPILLIPFFIVNGILTGTGLQEPVVWYNDAENLGIRMGTIPFEDVFYGLELILLTLFFFHLFNRKSDA